jgi:hypothetical protein
MRHRLMHRRLLDILAWRMMLAPVQHVTAVAAVST